MVTTVMATKKSKYKYVCQSCGAERSKWEGKCTECGSWNSLACELINSGSNHNRYLGPDNNSNKTIKSSQILTDNSLNKYSSGSTELDRALGGGIVQGSFILVGGSPGIGKSTLLLQVSGNLARNNKKVLYLSSEESVTQTGMRAKRLNVSDDGLEIGSQNNLEQVINMVTNSKPDVLILDSIQTVFLPDIPASIGSVSQVRECANQLLNVSKSHNITVFLVGHITKDGHLAGPKVLEHMVDTVLYFEGDTNYQYRLLRSLKNRFGSVQELGVFEMKRSGLIDVANPSEMFLDARASSVGSSIMVSMEGTRPLLCEVQALSINTYGTIPKRTSVGIDPNRLFIVMAVLDKFLNTNFASKDVFVSIVSGLKIREPAADLSVCAALLSSDTNKCLKDNMCLFGEIGLTGQVRSVPFSLFRFREGKKLGFDTFVTSSSSKKQLSRELSKDELNSICFISNIKELKEVLF